MDYLDFDLHLSPTTNGYRVRATNAQGATASADFVLPFTDEQIENLMLRVGRPRRGVRKIESPEMKAAKAFGGKLFDAVFAGEVFGLWRSSFNAATIQGKGLRLRLRLTETPELLDLPWEFLYDNARNQFVALLTKTPVVRFMDLPTPIQPLQVQLPLRVLVVISDPNDYDVLDVEREWANVRKATQALETRGAVTVMRLPNATLAELRRALRQNEYHVLHFIGHGAFVAHEQDGVLIFKNEQGRGQRVSSQTLAQVLANFDSLRLVILNACEGARTSRSDPFAGLAPGLVQQDKPAVIAMQFEVSDGAAITFADEFYSALADGYAVDAALTHARTAILTDVNDLEWGTPVLYMRAPNGVIFDLTGAPAQKIIEPKAEPPRIQVIAPEQKIVTPPPPKIEIPSRMTNKAGQEMLLIPAGEFLMGTSDAEAQRLIKEFGKGYEQYVGRELPQHTVSLDAFYISRYPVTNAEYKKFVDATNHRTPYQNADWAKPYNWDQQKRTYPADKANHPVVLVSWEDATAYAEWAGKRLPTEAEWEKAASWDFSQNKKRIFPWGDTFDARNCNTKESGINATTPVGKYSPRGDSMYGVGDMAGNVWEWCADWYDENYYSDAVHPKNSPRENPRNDTASQYRVLRGGAWNVATGLARCASRVGSLPGYLSLNLGFRCARSFS